MNVQQQRAKWAAFIADPTDLVHGTCNGYTNRGCRCQPCRDAWSERHRAYMATHDEQRAQHRMRSAARRKHERDLANLAERLEANRKVGGQS